MDTMEETSSKHPVQRYYLQELIRLDKGVPALQSWFRVLLRQTVNRFEFGDNFGVQPSAFDLGDSEH